MGIKNLPGPGIKFSTKSIARKLGTAVSRDLRPHRDAIVEGLEPYQGAIRDNRFTESRIKAALRIIKSSDKLTEGNVREAKKVLEHFGRSAAAKAAKLPVGEKGGKFIIIGGKKQYFSPERLKLNSRRTMQRDESALEEGGRRANISVLGKVGGGVKGSAAGRFGLGGQSTGFAQNYKQNKSADSAPPKAPLGGQKPLGF